MKATLISLVCLTALGTFGCRTLPDVPGREVQPLVEGRLHTSNPSDIAVLPVEDQTGARGVPVQAFRNAFYEGLVRRRYSPLALDYVDRGVVEASYRPGMFDEEAAFVCYLTEWDDSAWSTRYRLTISADVYLLDASPSVGGRELWGGNLTKTISVDSDRTVFGSDTELKKLAARRFVDEVLGALPARDPRNTRLSAD